MSALLKLPSSALSDTPCVCQIVDQTLHSESFRISELAAPVTLLTFGALSRALPRGYMPAEN